MHDGGSKMGKLAIIGAGNIGRAIARGLVRAGRYVPAELILTRRRVNHLADMANEGFVTTSDNLDALEAAEIVLVAVEPQQLNGVLHELGTRIDPERHLLISVVSGATISDIQRQLCLALGEDEAFRIKNELAIVRAMPNTAIALGQSMTCLASSSGGNGTIERAVSIFDAVGRTLVITEELMVPATALGACGVAFFLRSIRAASQGGIEIGFHPEEALVMAAQTALGAASLLQSGESHPEREIDSVTTPRGCTIAGLNEMEHRGFSSAMIKGIVTSAIKADQLYSGSKERSK
jgi:pyrroline-5-carboxylate reductase